MDGHRRSLRAAHLASVVVDLNSPAGLRVPTQAAAFTLALALPLATAIFFCSGCGGSDSGTNPPPPVDEGVTLADTTIDASADTVTFTIPGELTLVIPAGAAPAGTKLKIVRPDEEYIPADSLRTPVEVYDVTLGSLAAFDPPLEVTIHYDTTEAASEIPNAVGAAWYNEDAGAWSIYPGAVVDTLARTVRFTTNHLTKLSRWRLSKFTDWRSTLHFDIYWVESGIHAPVSDAVYNHKPAWHVGTDPDYIQDLAYYLEQAYDSCQAKGLTVHSGRISVYVQHMQDNGETSFFGYLTICNHVQGVTVPRPTHEELQATAAHEFMHYVQDYYYVQLFSDYTTKWWLEATATLADRIVNPTKSWFESYDYSNLQVDNYMHKAWDDCASDPAWYVAGGFLTYLSAHRIGTHASPAEIIKQGGANGPSYIRTALDGYLKTSLSSPGIGPEFHDYIVWAYQGSGPIRLQNPAPSATAMPADLPIRLANGETETAKTSFPRLSARVAKVVLNDNEDWPLAHRLAIRAKTVPASMKAYAYAVEPGGVVRYLAALAGGDSLVTQLRLRPGPAGETRVDVLLINQSKDDAATPEIEFDLNRLVSVALGVNEKIDGRCLDLHGNQVRATLNGVLFGGEGAAVTGHVQTAEDWSFEYPTRTLEVKVNGAAFGGAIRNPRVVFTEPTETIVDSLATAGWMWEWLEYTTGQMSLRDHETEEWSHPTFSGNEATASGLYSVWGFEVRASARSRYTWLNGGETESAERTYNFRVYTNY
ncbi:MAG: hypothetical protein EHM19_02750 [Candidatus Latescibacterota bacterium]|nr:MAG: hypothetical protein EHM19_02750 [Candidatus Latescibacterota bacterium]